MPGCNNSPVDIIQADSIKKLIEPISNRLNKFSRDFDMSGCMTNERGSSVAGRTTTSTARKSDSMVLGSEGTAAEDRTGPSSIVEHEQKLRRQEKRRKLAKQKVTKNSRQRTKALASFVARLCFIVVFFSIYFGVSTIWKRAELEHRSHLVDNVVHSQLQQTLIRKVLFDIREIYSGRIGELSTTIEARLVARQSLTVDVVREILGELEMHRERVLFGNKVCFGEICSPS